MPNPIAITEPKQLIVEGADAVRFFRALLRHMAITDIQIQNFGGIKDLRAFLKALYNMPDFLTLVTSVGIVRDAETDAGGVHPIFVNLLFVVRASCPLLYAKRAFRIALQINIFAKSGCTLQERLFRAFVVP